MSGPQLPTRTSPGASPDGRILTIPNAVTLLRFLLIAPICWMIVADVAHGSWTPVVLLAVWASTDWVDGVLARALDQRSRAGEVMDPIADRLGIAAILTSLAVVGAVAWWILAVIVAVDAVVVAFTHRAARGGTLHVSWAGKSRTAVMLVAIVLLVLGLTVWPPASAIATVLLSVGLVLHVVAGAGYIRAARRAA